MLPNHFVLVQKPVGKTRRELADIICKVIGMEVQFTGVPRMMYLIGGWTIERDGTLKTPALGFDNLGELQNVMTAISSHGIGFDGFFSLEISDDELSDSQQTNLHNVFQRKEILIKKALDADLKLVFGDNIQFAGLRPTTDISVLKVYIHLVQKLIDHARGISKASPKQKPVINEKYDFRCFLLRLGFIGEKYKEDRKILLQNLSGNSAFKNGIPTQTADPVESETAHES